MVAIIPLLILSASIGCSVNAAPSSANAPISLPGYNAPSNTYRILDDSTSSKSDVAFRAGDDTDTDGDGIPDYENSPTIIDDDTAVEAAKAYVAGKTTTPVKDIALMSIVKSPHNGITHVHLVETHNSLQIANLVSNVNVCSKTGAIVSAGLIEMERKPAEKPPSRYGLYRRSTVSSTQAVEIAAKALGYDTKGLSSSLKVSGDGVITGAPFAIGDIIFSEKYYLTASAKLEKVWDLQIRHTNGWHNLFVSVESGDVIGSASWTAKDSFDVADDGSSDSSSSSNPFGMSDEENRESIFPEAAESDNDVEDRQASRTDDTTSSANDKKKPIATISAVPITFNSILDGSEKFINPGLIDVSVDGWFGNPTTKGELELRGNNIHVVDGQGKSAVSRNGGKFDRVYNTKLDAADPNNREAAMTNVFFISNLYHDIMYKYGFTEKSSNFQNNTFTRGGQGNDAITSYVQSDDGANNAFFMTPPDGNPGVMT
ncbi:Fungalysin metallopeptidase-domain-containing protein, partial [Chytridium lagenaria]